MARSTRYYDPRLVEKYADSDESPTELIIYNLTPSQWATLQRKAGALGVSVHLLARDAVLLWLEETDATLAPASAGTA